MHRPDFPTLRRVAGGLLTGACFAAAFVASALFIGAHLPFPDVAEAGEKHAWFAQHGDRYDALFLGSSRIEMQIVPAVFNQRAAELGHPLTVFNAGVSAMTPPEDAYFFDALVRCPHPRLRWVFIELLPVALKPDRTRREGGRLAYWHDRERSAILWQCFAAEVRWTRAALGQKKQRAKSWTARLAEYGGPAGQYLEHVRLFLQREVNLGTAVPLAARFVTGTPPLPSTAEDGWVKSPGVLAATALADYERSLTERRETPQTSKPGNPAGAVALHRLLEKIARAGAAPVLLIPPTTGPSRFEPPPDIRQSCIVLDFSDPREFPELFAPENRLDSEHLSAAGAPVFTRLVAERFAATLAARP